MDRDINYYMKLPYFVEVVPDQYTDGSLCYRALHPELPGCVSHGDTPEEAEKNLKEARRLYIETLIERNLPVPEPKGLLKKESHVTSANAKEIKVDITTTTINQPSLDIKRKEVPFKVITT